MNDGESFTVSIWFNYAEFWIGSICALVSVMFREISKLFIS